MPSGMNWNNITSEDEDFFAGNAAASDGTNTPVNRAGILECRGTGGYFWHRYTEYASGWITYKRARGADGSWSTWKKTTAA